MKPNYIRTLEELTAGVRIGTTTESLVLDFKGTIDKWNLPKTTNEHDKLKAHAQRETCRDVAQFANTNGGCLLVGVQERLDPVSGLKVAIRIRAVTETDRMIQWIEQAIRKYLIPTTFSHDIVPICHSQGTVLAVNVPPSLHLVSLWDPEQHSIECTRRTSHGKDWMNPDELERHLMNGSRAARLAFDAARAEASQEQVHIVGGCWQRSRNTSTGAHDQAWRSARVTVGLVTDRWFELQFSVGENTLPLNLPYGVIKEAWVGTDECLNLLLSIQVVYWKDQLLIEPGPERA